MLRNSGKPELRCNPSSSLEALFPMDARVKPGHDESMAIRITSS
jgi:hypothetical protein